jgi:hypothetical protein
MGVYRSDLEKNFRSVIRELGEKEGRRGLDRKMAAREIKPLAHRRDGAAEKASILSLDRPGDDSLP